MIHAVILRQNFVMNMRITMEVSLIRGSIHTRVEWSLGRRQNCSVCLCGICACPGCIVDMQLDNVSKCLHRFQKGTADTSLTCWSHCDHKTTPTAGSAILVIGTPLWDINLPTTQSAVDSIDAPNMKIPHSGITSNANSINEAGRSNVT